jgi:periplasmic divalent cation tolerance protein
VTGGGFQGRPQEIDPEALVPDIDPGFPYASAMTSPSTTSDTVLLCYCTCPDTGSAQAIAETLVGEHLAACVNRLPGIVSTYRWQGALTSDTETLLLIKSTVGRFEMLKARLLHLHPYELPELIAVPVERGHTAYLDWVRDSVSAEPTG